MSFARFLAREAADAGLQPCAQGQSWVLTDALPHGASAADGLCFAHTAMIHPIEIHATSVNASARAILGFFLESCREEKFTDPWPVRFSGDDSVAGLVRRSTAVERTFLRELTKRFARVAKLARDEPIKPHGLACGLFAYWRSFEYLWVSREAILGGQRRMADDPGAPSRSYLKLEEAYGIMGREPQPGETVADLGAAPGGWSLSAAKRGARVLALDNGPLKGAALDNPLIEHEQADAFRFVPRDAQRFDWLLCDVVDDPNKVLALLEKWVTQRWCRRFVVNLKFGRTDPLPLLHRATSPSHPLACACSPLLARHLFHDREEFTLVGELRG